jgi:predicted RNase H-like HicB family nuclease
MDQLGHLDNQFDILIDHDSETGLYVVEVLDLPSVYSQGASREEAMENIREAIRLHLSTEVEPPHRGHRELARIDVA